LVGYKVAPEQFGMLPHAAPVGVGQRPWSGAVVARWNNPESVDAAFTAFPDGISAIICEPLLCNSGCIPAEPGFLEFLRETATKHGALLIFDEVITGFRLALGGGQQYYGVTPDLATFAKAVGAGLPLSVLAGKLEYMQPIADGKVVHAGTLNGNPLALAACVAALRELSAPGIYERLHRLGTRLRHGMEQTLRNKGIDVVTTGEGPCFQLHFQSAAPREYRDTLATDKALYASFLMALLDAGIYALPDGRWYISTAHTDDHIDRTLHAVSQC
jgi:glutamate-1-semialdehyde 2,1-aminomutase